MHTCSCVHSLPTDVQAEAIPLILGGGDVLMVNDLNYYREERGGVCNLDHREERGGVCNLDHREERGDIRRKA